MTLVLPFVFVFLSAVRVGLGREKEHDCLSYPPITAPEYSLFFFYSRQYNSKLLWLADMAASILPLQEKPLCKVQYTGPLKADKLKAKSLQIYW